MNHQEIRNELLKVQKRNSRVAVGEFDMVVVDNANATCEIYQVKHSKEQAKEQFRLDIGANKGL